MLRIRRWRLGYQQFGQWSYSSTDTPEDLLLDDFAGSLPERDDPMFRWPDSCIWEIQKETSNAQAEACGYRPVLTATVTIRPLTVRLVRYDRPTSAVDAILASKIREWIIHHHEMLAGGWTHYGGGCYIVSPSPRL